MQWIRYPNTHFKKKTASLASMDQYHEEVLFVSYFMMLAN